MGLGVADYINIGTTAANVGGGLLGGILTNKANAKENQKNRDWNLMMWNKANEYNLPTNVRKRLESAGLNPALMYSNGDGSSLSSYAGNLGTQRAYENPMNGINLNDFARLRNESIVAESQVKLNEAEAYKNTAEGNRISTENEYLPQRLKHEINILGYEESIKNIEEFVKQQTYNQEIEIVVQEAQQKILNTEISREQKKIVIQQLANLAEEYNNLVKQGKVLEAEELVKKSVAKLNNSQAAYNDAMAALAPYQKQKLIAETKSFVASAVKYYSEAGVSDQQAEKIANDIEEQLIQGNFDRAYQIATMYGSGAAAALERLASRAADLVNGKKFNDVVAPWTRKRKFLNHKRRK